MTNDARRVIESRLNSIKTQFNIAEISYRLASEDAMFPHLVWEINGINPTDMGREDYEVDVHVWDRYENQARAWNIADAVIDLFSWVNSPQETILPTFYETTAFPVDDPDKSIVHIVCRSECQVYANTSGGTVWQQ